jgi:hypothetical protein
MFSKTYCGVADNQPVWLCQAVHLLTVTNSVSGGVGRIVNEITSSHEAPYLYSKGWSSEPFGNWLTTISIFVGRPLYSFLKTVMADITCLNIFYSYHHLCNRLFFYSVRLHVWSGAEEICDRRLALRFRDEGSVEVRISPHLDDNTLRTHGPWFDNWIVTSNVSNKQSRIGERGWSSNFEVRLGLQFSVA